LDAYWSKDFIKEQMRVLEEQVSMAAAAGLPVITHLREATEDFFRVLEDLRGVDFRGVMHAYSGSYEVYRRLLGYADFKFGIGGVVTYKNAGIAAALEKMSLDDIVLETDCPWLTPVPYRGKRNEPAYVRLVAEKVAQIKGLPLEEVAAVTTRSAQRLFNL
ncbi:MAG: TatD family hydrolase, partial [Bacteroidales bacterium]|nr:TatD family hydrolase [Bacteroidales bacterium]